MFVCKSVEPVDGRQKSEDAVSNTSACWKPATPRNDRAVCEPFDAVREIPLLDDRRRREAFNTVGATPKPHVLPSKLVVAFAQPKIGSTSLISSLTSANVSRTMVYRHAPPNFRDYFTVAFFRDPVSRLLSLYSDLDVNRYVRQGFYSHPESRHCTNTSLCSFHELVTQIKHIFAKVGTRGADKHIQPQAIANPEMMRYDFLGRLESAADRGFFYGRLLQVPEMHAHNSHKRCIALSNDTLALIEELYADDFRLLRGLRREPVGTDYANHSSSCEARRVSRLEYYKLSQLNSTRAP